MLSFSIDFIYNKSYRTNIKAVILHKCILDHLANCHSAPLRYLVPLPSYGEVKRNTDGNIPSNCISEVHVFKIDIVQ